jgi:glycosyltransferase involved in cell wall biosynthesis
MTRPVKVIQVLTHSLTPARLGVDPRFYEEDWHFRLAKELIKRTNEFEIECWRPEITFKKIYIRKNKDQIVSRIFPSFFLNMRLKSIEFSLPLLISLSKEVQKNKKIIVHVHGLYNPITYLVGFFIGKKVPVLVQSHGGCPARITFEKSHHPLRKIFYLFKHAVQYFSFHNISHFFVLSKEEEEYLSLLFGREKVEIMPMGVDLEKFRPMNKDVARKKLGLNVGKQYLLYVGRLLETKGLKYLLIGFKLALEETPDIKLILVGDGPYKEELKVICKTLGIEKEVLFKGFIPNEELPLYYNAADIFIFPSLSESWGIAPLEALSCGTPVISTNVGCIPQVSREVGGVTIIPRQNSLAIKDAITRSLNHLDSIKRGIRLEMLKKYSWSYLIQKTIETYKKLLDKYP